MTSGQQANRSGGQLENFIEDALIRRGYSEFWNHKAQAFANRSAIGGKQYLKQVPVGPTIYQTARIADFLVFNKEKFPDGLIIECKWQQSAGSVDEKYPFLLFNVIKTAVPTVILLDGGGYKPAAKQWLSEQVDKDMNRALWGVWDMAECQRRINNGFFG